MPFDAVRFATVQVTLNGLLILITSLELYEITVRTAPEKRFQPQG